MPRILVIDDDTSVRLSTERILRAAGYTVETASEGEEGFTLASRGGFDVILSDMRMPGLSGLELLHKLREHRIDAAFLIMSAYGTIETAVEAMRLGAVDFVQKPFVRDELLLRVRGAAERRHLARHVNLLQRHLRPAGSVDALIGESPVMAQVKERIRRAAPAPGTVLITGETGTGKELAARAIHAGSGRADRAFIAINCAALSESLLENELFGHGKGAFTGAVGPRAGLIEHATGGTLFLDEIGTMSKPLQAKLLRALESGEVRRMGENDSRRVDVRFVAATNVELKGAIEKGEFRADLFYRLNVHLIHMPPLRERGGDLRLLVENFLARFGPSAGVERCGQDAWALLSSYDYPGNVRQLEHMIQRAVAIAQGPELQPEDLPEEVTSPPAPFASAEGTVAAARQRADREAIVATLARHGGEIGAAARELQISRTTLWRLMKKYDLGG